MIPEGDPRFYDFKRWTLDPIYPETHAVIAARRRLWVKTGDGVDAHGIGRDGRTPTESYRLVHQAICRGEYPALLPEVLLNRANEERRRQWIRDHQPAIRYAPEPAPTCSAWETKMLGLRDRLSNQARLAPLGERMRRTRVLHESTDSKIRRGKYPPLLKRQA